MAAAPALVAPETADVEAPEPQVLERPYLPTQDDRFSDSSDDSSTNDTLFHARTLRDTPTHMNSGERRLPAEAIPTDRQSPLRPLSRSQNSHAISGAGAGVGLAALAAGGGLAVGSSDSCGIRGFFGNCQDQSKANAENVRRLADFQNSLTDYVTEFITNTDEKLFLVENELAALNAIQSEMAAIQDKNWVIIQEQLAVYEQFFYIFA